MYQKLLLTVFLSFSTRVLAAPATTPPVITVPENVTIPPVPLDVDTASLKAQSVSPISTAEISSYIPYEYFSAAAYCPPDMQAKWNCKFCQAQPVKDFVVYASGGDGNLVQYSFLPVPVNSKLFPGTPSSARVHFGFQEAHERTAAVVLSTVKKVIAERGATKVVTVGHSLGGALALLDGLYLKLNLPSNIEIITRTIGQPRVGNDAFAKFVDQKVSNLIRITNKGDLVPGLPPLILGFKHNVGEKHINKKGEWNACSGQDNLDVSCSTGQLLKQGIVLTDHLGPYAGGFYVPDLKDCYFV
ncbi:Lipase OS=Rhizopus niveus PE=1 SV=1 [Rhizoctonia solani AG-1 IB]|uniref:Lipase n=1 Tax=Thanatephorus cucumeris (strain AG1-IB / isolate 7/3/14) TaxID=1108050 RepID=M5C210_THACB|nr:Lipase [Rhizoctonia solani AG-1 IB]CEL61975.1 Lipase OS=Rhizopus niveus PE=1 SV=1 [Rhizoctonia solani AG-1 IB]